MKDNAPLVEPSARGVGPRLDYATKSVFVFLVLVLFGVALASLTLSLLDGSYHQAVNSAVLLLIYVPFWRVFIKRGRKFTITAILIGVIFMWASSWTTDTS